jgi:hypothetical protein
MCKSVAYTRKLITESCNCIFLTSAYRWKHSKLHNFPCASSLLHILTYIQQDATLHSLFYLETALHVSGGTSTHHQERKQLCLQHLVIVRSLLLPAAIAAGSSNGLTLLMMGDCTTRNMQSSFQIK